MLTRSAGMNNAPIQGMGDRRIIQYPAVSSVMGSTLANADASTQYVKPTAQAAHEWACRSLSAARDAEARAPAFAALLFLNAHECAPTARRAQS